MISKPKPLRSDRYREWIASMPCLICGRKPSEAAHMPVNGRGTATKANDAECIPLCHECHFRGHNDGELTLWKGFLGLETEEQIKGWLARQMLQLVERYLSEGRAF